MYWSSVCLITIHSTHSTHAQDRHFITIPIPLCYHHIAFVFTAFILFLYLLLVLARAQSFHILLCMHRNYISSSFSSHYTITNFYLCELLPVLAGARNYLIALIDTLITALITCVSEYCIDYDCFSAISAIVSITVHRFSTLNFLVTLLYVLLLLA